VARAAFKAGRLDLTGIDVTAAGTSIAGTLAAGVEPNTGGRLKVTGSLGLDRAALPAFAALVLGPSQAPRAPAIWSDARFPPGLGGVPPTEIALKIGQFQLTDRLQARDATLRLGLAPGYVSLDDVHARLGDGPLAGHLTLRRDGQTAALSGAVSVEGIPIDRPSLSGRLSGRLSFTSTGQSAAALAGGLAGDGTATITGLVIPRADPGAPARVLAQTDAGDIYISENDFMGALRNELDKAPRRVGDTAFRIGMAGGNLRLAGSNGISIGLDLRRLSLETRATLEAGALPKDWTGPAPQLTVVWKGPLANPVRDIEAGSFISALTARAVAREAARVEALEADIRERAFFMRRQKGLEFMHRREAEIAAYKAEQARLAAEQARQEAERARQAAEDEKRKAAEAERLRLQEAARIERERRAEQDRQRTMQAPPPKPPPTAGSRPIPAPVNIVPAPAPALRPGSGPAAHGIGLDPSAAGRY
jgi:hypothetical protein